MWVCWWVGGSSRPCRRAGGRRHGETGRQPVHCTARFGPHPGRQRCADGGDWRPPLGLLLPAQTPRTQAAHIVSVASPSSPAQRTLGTHTTHWHAAGQSQNHVPDHLACRAHAAACRVKVATTKSKSPAATYQHPVMIFSARPGVMTPGGNSGRVPTTHPSRSGMEMGTHPLFIIVAPS